METEPVPDTKGRNSHPDRKSEIVAAWIGWKYPDELPEHLPPPAMTPPRDGPHLLQRPSASTSQEAINLIRSTSTSGGGSKSPRSTNEDCLHAPSIPGAVKEQPSATSPVLPVAQRSAFNGSTNSIEFVTVIVPLTRLSESIIKTANPHIKLALASPQLHSSDFLESASEPYYFEEPSPHSSLLNDTAHPKAETKQVGIPTEISQSAFESATPVLRRRPCESPNSTITSTNKGIPPAPLQTTPHPSEASTLQLPTKISRRQQIHNSEKQDKRFLCVFCDKVFPRYSFFEDHLRSHIKEVPFECPDCGKGFSKEYSYKDHLKRYCRVRHKDKRHRCLVCQKSFSTKCNMEKHLQLHSSQRKIHRCSLCPATFTTQPGLHYHKKVKHEKERHQCEECGALLAHRSFLLQHMKRHRNIKPNSCLFCNKAFVTNQELFRHLRCHTREEEVRLIGHSCTFCGKTFPRRHLLYSHLCVHIREKWHACNFCGKQFTSKRSTLSHIGLFHRGG